VGGLNVQVFADADYAGMSSEDGDRRITATRTGHFTCALFLSF